ncbi:MAG: STAS domain-containing protein [Gemmatimonadota bacterium]|nr:STAS domain-containing protein [Gemmatimonadota bacterium]
MGFDIKWERIQGILVAIILGRIDSSNADEFQRVLDAGTNSADQALLLDFERVSYISSAGLRVGLIMAKQFKAPGKQFGICALSGSVREVVVASGFDEIISIYESRDAAIGEFKKN